MKKIVLIIILVVICHHFHGSAVNGNVVMQNSSWKQYFKEAGVDGTFVLLNLKTGDYFIFNKKRSEKRFLPASTFKIMNTLIALESKSISSIDEEFYWDGTARSYEAWNKDLSVREAFRVSAVWVYQEMARRTGREKIEEWMVNCNYGNMKTGPEIDRFWLDGETAISAQEQVLFLQSLYREELPFSIDVQQKVKDLMLADSAGDKRLYAKTGWAARVKHQIGWYVGFVENGDDAWIFALNIDINKEEDTRYRIEITREILDAEGIFPKRETSKK
ncbi:MAG: class D beta-lactamase [Lentimicrobium sp.]